MCLLSNHIAEIFDHQYFWKESSNILLFLHRDSHKRKLVSETTDFGWVWLVVLLVQLDCRVLWSTISLQEINWCLRFLHEDIYQGKVACETTAFAWVRLGVCHIQYSQKNPIILKTRKNLSLLFLIQHRNYEKLLKLASISMKIVYS